MATREKRHNNATIRNYDCPDLKIVYASKREALQQAANSDLTLTPYKCPHCKEWHLTSSVTRDKVVREHKQVLFKGQALTLEDGYWTCPKLPGRFFLELRDIRTALLDYLKLRLVD